MGEEGDIFGSNQGSIPGSCLRITPGGSQETIK